MTTTEDLRAELAKKWKKRDGSTDEKMVDYCLKSSNYIKLGDYWVNCGDKKPRIQSDLWYDDETEGPDDTRYEAFKEYNMRSNKQPMLSEQSEFGGVREVWLAKNYYGDEGNRLLAVIVKRADDLPRAGELRKATADEIEAINKARAEVNADYEKRLERYWKRYNSKVMARGYWANR